MKVGSLVVIKKRQPVRLLEYITWLPNCDESTIYTIREIEMSNARLEEGVIGYLPNGRELAIGLSNLIEIQPPMEITIEELINETCEA